MHGPTPAEGLVIAGWVDAQSPDELAIGADDAYVRTGDEELDLAISVFDSDGDVAEPTEVAKRDFAKRIDLVMTDAVVDDGGLLGGPGLEE